MAKEVNNGIYTDGKKSFRVLVLDKTVELTDATDTINIFSLKIGEKTKDIPKEFVKSALDRELKDFRWLKE
jgi:hypothetical protein